MSSRLSSTNWMKESWSWNKIPSLKSTPASRNSCPSSSPQPWWRTYPKVQLWWRKMNSIRKMKKLTRFHKSVSTPLVSSVAGEAILESKSSQTTRRSRFKRPSSSCWMLLFSRFISRVPKSKISRLETNQQMLSSMITMTLNCIHLKTWLKTSKLI